ncbi:MAG: preprotein translocase subunit SecA [Chloroflexi bacterium]|nr:preprotein translocase subunit SecA [Chloroflexota bacterium]
MLNVLRRFVGDSNDRALKEYWPLVARVNEHADATAALSDDALRALTAELRARVSGGAALDEVLPEALAVAREAIARVTGERAFDVQVLGAIALHRGTITEMKTGEGKTLVAALSLYLNALAGQGAHLVTVNDYLARRDSQWYGPALHALGLSIGVLQHDQAYVYTPGRVSEQGGYEHLLPVSRREAYAADITYGTNNEYGFDYLRDNMAQTLEEKVQRTRHYAIVDEADSVLIDEARTPLIISGPQQEDLSIYPRFAKLVPSLERDVHYVVEERTRSVHLTEAGVDALERGLRVDNIYSPENFRLTRYMEAALKAQIIYQRDRDYVVKDGEIVIVDDFTGRLMEGRRWSDGLHQAVEAKESVKIQHESITYATITLQNFFRMYEKLAGMTGTAVTEAEELAEIYKLEVLTIPTHRPMIREDLSDLVYATQDAKYRAVVDDVVEKHEAGRPVLVGTVAIETSEYLSDLLRRRGVEHEVLNAKQHAREAAIVARAGQHAAVTIATNMAGRGTDIKLGDGVAVLGGLHIIGTERHESRRIDNQLRGRSGRQGDPGSSRFFVSFEDEIMRRFAPDWLPGLMSKLGMEDDQPLESRMVTRAIETAQQKVEAYNFDIRKHVVEYDDVMNTHRDVIYGERDRVLAGESLQDTVRTMIDEEIEAMVQAHLGSPPRDVEGGLAALEAVLPLDDDLRAADDLDGRPTEGIIEQALELAERRYAELEAEHGEDAQRLIERVVVLRTIDQLWVLHLTAVDEMRQGIGLRAYGSTDPLVAYKREAHDMWEQLLENIRSTVARQIFHARVVPGEQPAPARRPARLQESGPTDTPGVPAAAGGAATATATRTAPAQAVRKVGRNEPCPCGSGQKYKRCHGLNA